MSEIDTSEGPAEPGRPPRRLERGVGSAACSPPVIDLAAWRRQAASRTTGSVATGDEPEETEDPAGIEDAPAPIAESPAARPAGGDDPPGAAVQPLNDAATIYDALAEEIRGSAVGWSDSALAQLERGLLQRYGPLIGGRHPVRRLVRLAARHPAA